MREAAVGNGSGTANPSRVGEYERLRELEWEPKSVTAADTILDTTKYELPKHGYDPFRLTAIEYSPMEAQKDQDLFGVIDGAVRRGAASRIEPRWGEYVKIIAGLMPLAEHYAMRTFGRAVRAIDVPELQAGYSFQMLDEMRHFQIGMTAWNRFRLKHGYIDPYGFDRWAQMSSRNILGNVVRSAVEAFVTNDPVSNLVFLQMFTETATTNALFVGLPDVAAMNGDDVYSTCGLTIQSDEARHMANGYATLMSIVEASDRNVGLLQEDILECAWREFVSFTVPIAFVFEYGATRRPSRSFKELWREWVLEQFYGSYMSKLEKWGIKIPDEMIADLQEWITWAPHTLGVFSKMVWPFVWYRQDPLTPADYEYFEEKYPGWYERYGLVHQLIDETSTRGNGTIVTYEGIQILGKDLQLCHVCHLPTIMPEALAEADRFRRFVDEGGRTISFCSPWCQRIFDQTPQRYDHPTWFEHYDAWSWGDILRDQQLIRPDGTLLGQPRLDTLGTDQMWTIDDIDALGHTFDMLRS